MKDHGEPAAPINETVIMPVAMNVKVATNERPDN
jgi:hypothetical protein